MQDSLILPVLLKTLDNVSTDDIMPAGAKVLPFRSNIPEISKFCFTVCDEEFPERAKNLGKSIIFDSAVDACLCVVRLGDGDSAVSAVYDCVCVCHDSFPFCRLKIIFV